MTPTPSRSRWDWLRAFVLLTGVAFVIVSCASGPRIADHAFGFDARVDSPDIWILSYRYGSSSMPSTTAETSIRQFGQSPQVAAIRGPIPIGEALYVKWQIKATQAEFEDTVDLKPLLPFSMQDKRIYFVVQGPQLHVYLTDLTMPRARDAPIVGPFRVQSYVTQQIYPTRFPK